MKIFGLLNVVLSVVCANDMRILQGRMHAEMATMGDTLNKLHTHLLSRHQDTHSWIINTHKSAANAHKMFDVQKTTSGCVTQIASSALKLVNCTNKVISAFAKTNDASGTYSAFSAAITEYCDAKCADLIETEVGDMIEKCSSKEDRLSFFSKEIIQGSGTTVQSLFLALKAPCFKAQGEDGYCFPRYLKGFKQLSKVDMNSPTTTEDVATGVLNVFCSPCTTGLFRLFSQAALSKSSQKEADNFFTKGYNLFCLKEGNDFCIVKTMQLVRIPKDTTNALATTSKVLCNKCVSTYIAAAVDLIKEAAPGQSWGALAALLQFICEKDSGGKHCWQKLTNSVVANFTSCASTDWFSKSTGVSCPADCKAGLANVKNSVGCCTGNLMVIWQALSLNKVSQIQQAADVGQTFATFAKDLCTVDLFEPCAANKLVFTKKLMNLRQDFLDDNKAKVLDAVRQDIALQVNEPATAITVGEVAFLDKKATFNVTIVPKLQEAGIVLTKMQREDVWAHVDQLLAPPERADPLLPITADPTDVQTVDIKTGGVVTNPPTNSIGDGANTGATLAVPATTLLLLACAVLGL